MKISSTFSTQTLKPQYIYQPIKYLSFRHKTKPKEYFQTMKNLISTVDNQVKTYNKRQRQLPQQYRKKTKRYSNTEKSKLKSMSQPKFQHLLMLPVYNPQSPPKRLVFRQSMSRSKNSQSHFLRSTSNELLGIKSKNLNSSKLQQSKVLDEKLMQQSTKTRIMQQCIGKKINKQFNNTAQDNYCINDMNLVQSKYSNCRRIKTLKERIQITQQKLSIQWNKTISYRLFHQIDQSNYQAKIGNKTKSILKEIYHKRPQNESNQKNIITPKINCKTEPYN